MAELTDDEKDAISHRGRAVRALAAWLRARDADERAVRPTSGRPGDEPPATAESGLKQRTAACRSSPTRG